MGDESSLDSDFDDIIFEDLPPISETKPFIRSTKKQRELLERLAATKGMHYASLVRKCNEVLNTITNERPYKQIKDIGELSLGEADLIIKEIGGIRK